MKIKIFIISLFLLQFGYSKYDTISVKTISEGVKLIQLEDKSIPWKIKIVEADLSNPSVKIVPAFANDSVGRVTTHAGGCLSKQTISKIVANRKSQGDSVVAAINSDFFEMSQTGLSFNLGTRDGFVATTGIIVPNGLKKHSAMCIDDKDLPTIGIIDMGFSLYRPDLSSIPVNSYNFSRGTDQLIIYNSYLTKKSKQTLTNQWGTEYLISVAENQRYLNAVMEATVEKIEKNIGNMKFGDNQMVISANGTSQAFLQDLQVGQKVKLYHQLKGFGSTKIKHVIGGYPQIVKNGANYVATGTTNEGMTGADASLSTSRHPRSAAGYNQAKTKFYLFCVDGRQAGVSLGMTLDELAQLMLDYGIYDGINFDGGGSTGLWADGKVVNVPSDGPGTERAVSNAIMIVKKKTSSSIFENKKNSDFSELEIYPNPVRNELTIEFNSKIETTSNLKIYSIDGKLVRQVKQELSIGKNKITTNVESLQQGTYIYVIGNSSNSINGKFIKD